MEAPPKLIEHGVKYHMQRVLQKCSEQRIRIYSFALNAFILVVFTTIVVATLWYCHTHKLTPKEKLYKMRKDQEYVLSKIRQFQIEKDSQKEQFSRLLNRVSTSQPSPSMGSVYIPTDEDDIELPPVSTLANQGLAPAPPSYRDILFREIVEERRKQV